MLKEVEGGELMNLIKCSNGHYYDGDKFDYCPHCAGVSSNESAGDMTVSIDITPNQEMEHLYYFCMAILHLPKCLNYYCPYMRNGSM